MDNSGYTTPGAYEKITVDGASVLTAATRTVGRDSMAWLSIETDQIRIRLDGTAPTSAEGLLVNVGDNLVIYGRQALANLIMIKVTAAASVKVQYFHAL
jgi:hypothetical protein